MDTKQYFVIASEGADTERIYFEGLSRFINEKESNKMLKIVEFLERTTEEDRKKSAHKDVIKQLDYYKKTFRLDDKDELWLVIDRDKGNNKLHQIADIAQACAQKKYFLALSNPNFELWLLLHLQDLENYSEEKLEIFYRNINFIGTTKKSLEKELSDLMNGYRKSNYDFQKFAPYISLAIERAKKLDNNLQERWIEDNLGTRVYLLVEKITAI